MNIKKRLQVAIHIQQNKQFFEDYIQIASHSKLTIYLWVIQRQLWQLVQSISFGFGKFCIRFLHHQRYIDQFSALNIETSALCEFFKFFMFLIYFSVKFINFESTLLHSIVKIPKLWFLGQIFHTIHSTSQNWREDWKK